MAEEKVAAKRGRKVNGRSNGEGTIRQRRDGFWEARVSVGPYEAKTIYAKTRPEIVKRLKDLLKEQEAGADLTKKREKVGEYLQRWLDETAATRVSERTLVEYRSIVRNHHIPVLGKVYLDKLAVRDVQKMVNAAIEKGLSPRRAHHLRAVLRTALNDARKQGLITRNVANDVAMPKADREPVKPLSPEQARALIAATDGTTYGGTFAVALYCGLRQGEVLGLRWQDIDFEAGTLTVAQSLKNIPGKQVFGPPKSRNSRRTIPLPVAAAEALRRQRDRQAFDRKAATEWQDTDLVFTKPDGSPMSAWVVRTSLQRALKQAGLPAQRFHDLRHACATLLLSAGVPLVMVSRILGHSTIDLTANTYGHIGIEAMRQAATVMDSLFETGT